MFQASLTPNQGAHICIKQLLGKSSMCIIYVVERVLHSNRVSLFRRQIVAGEEYCEITY